MITAIIILTCAIVIETSIIIYYKNKIGFHESIFRRITVSQQELSKINNEISNAKNYLQSITDNINTSTAELIKVHEQYNITISTEEKRLQESISILQQKECETIASYTESVNKAKAELDKVHGEYEAFSASIKASERRNEELLRQVKDNNKFIDELQATIDRLLDESRLAVLNSWNEEKMGEKDAPGWVFAKLTPNEEKLCELVSEIKITYPELSCEFGKIIWSKIWMPRIQSWVKMYKLSDMTNCIYKLTSIKDGRVCYIGQAVDVKDR